MISLEESIVIGRPAPEVFAYVSDQTNAPRWQRGLLDVRRTTDGPIGIGSRHTVVRKFIGRTLELSNEYTRYEPGTLVAFDWSGAMPGHASYVVEPAGSHRTRLTSRIEVRAAGMFRLAEPLISVSLGGEVHANLRTLKALLEAPAKGRSALSHPSVNPTSDDR